MDGGGHARLIVRFGVSALFLQIHTLTKKAMDDETFTLRFQKSFIKALSATDGEESPFVLSS
jgi:hypothetical protein